VGDRPTRQPALRVFALGALTAERTNPSQRERVFRRRASADSDGSRPNNRLVDHSPGA
jgi:hypothetical protein